MKRFSILLLLVAGIAYGATTFTTNYNFNKPGDGDRNYGELIRDNWDAVDAQIKINETSNADHLADTVDAHDASAISVVAGAFSCTLSTTVQEYLDCLDGTLDPSASGIVLLAGAQTITGPKTFSLSPLFPFAVSGILQTDAGGAISSVAFSDIDPLTTKGDLLAYDTGSVRLGVGTDGQQLYADSGEATGLKWDDPNPQWRKFTYTFSDFSAAASSFGLTAFSLAAEEGIDAVIVHHTTAFTGGAISAYTVEVGQSLDANQYSNAYDVFQAVSNTKRESTNVLDVPNFGATTDITVTARSTGANLDQATTGSVDIYIRTFLLP